MNDRPASRLRTYPLGVKVLAGWCGLVGAVLIVLHFGGSRADLVQKPILAAAALGLIALLSAWNLVTLLITYVYDEGE